MKPKEIRRIFSKIGLGISLFMIIQQGIAGIAALLIGMYAPHLTQNGWYFWILSYAPLYIIAFPILMLIFRTIPDCLPSSAEWLDIKKLSILNMAMLVCVAFGVVYPLNMLSTLLTTIIGAIKGREVINPLLNVVQNSSPWASLLFVVIIAPIMEELVFRKFLYNKLIQFGGKTYVIFSALVFAMFHGNLYQLLYAFVLGLILAGIMYYTRDIRYCMALHLIINLFGGGISAFLLNADMIVMGIYGMVILLIAGIGIVLGIVWWLKNHGSIKFTEPEISIGDKKLMLVNVGMIIYIMAILVLIAFSTLV